MNFNISVFSKLHQSGLNLEEICINVTLINMEGDSLAHYFIKFIKFMLVMEVISVYRFPGPVESYCLDATLDEFKRRCVCIQSHR